ncbi:MAG TPA: DNA-directed RNA polymerase subunit omega [Ruminiclostridium sp.]|nr:DNA-directed RNA polymerase subunit omega [Ruminiclostridium sp.]
MQKLSVEDIVKNNENCYSFVVAIAKRARQISEKSNDEGIILDEKPVQTAVQQFVEGRFRIAPKSEKNEDDGENSQIL